MLMPVLLGVVRDLTDKKDGRGLTLPSEEARRSPRPHAEIKKPNSNRQNEDSEEDVIVRQQRDGY